jgi:hypothetical protein
MHLSPAVRKYPRPKDHPEKWTALELLDNVKTSNATKLGVPWAVSIHGACFSYRESVAKNANITRYAIARSGDDLYVPRAAEEHPGDWVLKTWRCMENWAKAKLNHRRYVRGALQLIYSTKLEDSVSPAMKAVLESLACPPGASIIDTMKLPAHGRNTVLFPVTEHDAPQLLFEPSPRGDAEVITALGT